MYDPIFIGIDIGTQGTKAVLCNKNGDVLFEAFCKSNLIQPDSKTIYENPDDIFNSVITTIKELTQKAGDDSKRIHSICIDAQMAGIMAIDENFEAVTPLDSWLDSRCKHYTSLLQKEAGDEAIQCSGGQIIHSHASKILWWKNEEKDTYKRIKKFVMPNAYVAGKLCGLTHEDAFMDYTFLHFNIFSDNKNLHYNESLLKLFNVDLDKLPKIVSPTDIIGTISPYFSKVMGLPGGVSVLAGCGDTAASSIGAGITKKGVAYDVAGTASVFACATDKFVPDTKHKTLLFSRSILKDLYLPLSYINGGGLCLSWFSELTGKSFNELNASVRENPSIDTPIFIPHFQGRLFPINNNIEGAFLGLNFNTNFTAMYKAVMESIAFEYNYYLSILKDTNSVTDNLKIIGVGGGAKSDVFAQIKADVLNCSYIVPQSIDSAPVACALLASHKAGYNEENLSDLFSKRISQTKEYSPNNDEHQKYKPIYNKYLTLLDRLT